MVDVLKLIIEQKEKYEAEEDEREGTEEEPEPLEEMETPISYSLIPQRVIPCFRMLLFYHTMVYLSYIYLYEP